VPVALEAWPRVTMVDDDRRRRNTNKGSSKE
jgi:hypothetical protein